LPTQVTDEAAQEGLHPATEAGGAYLRMVDYFIAHLAARGGREETT
jgi:hypothetical protein